MSPWKLLGQMIGWLAVVLVGSFLILFILALLGVIS